MVKTVEFKSTLMTGASDIILDLHDDLLNFEVELVNPTVDVVALRLKVAKMKTLVVGLGKFLRVNEY